MRMFFCGIVALALAQSAFATIEVTLTDTKGTAATGDDVTVVLSGAAAHLYGGTVGDWTVSFLTSVKSAGIVTMDLSSIDSASTAAGSLIIQFTETDIATAAQAFALTASGHLVSGAGTAAMAAWYDNNNTPYGTGSLIGSLGPFSAIYGASVSGGSSGVPLYSLTEQVTLTAAAGGVEWSTDTSVSSVPEPAAVILLGSMLVLCTSKLRRKLV
jgi:hypothetical protein